MLEKVAAADWLHLKVTLGGKTSPQILYPTTATTRDYAYEQHGAMSMTLEVGQDFRPSYAEVEQIWAEMRVPLLGILEAPGLAR